jgi:UDP-N-acetylmuramoylalanine--D-glutamate ligase
VDLRGKKVLVMGLGVHGGGLGVTRWLLAQGARVTVTDLKTADQLKPSLDALSGTGVEFVLGEHRDSDLTTSDLIVRNPGVPRESKYLALAKARGIPIEMEMGLFFQRLPRGAEQVIGITGTKGKTTTTLMVGGILEREEPKTVIAGNLRVSALELLDKIDAETPVVLELSSWQLEAFETDKTSPKYAAITNISADHLNRYSSFDEYGHAKALIFRYQQPNDFAVLNFDNPTVTQLRRRAIGRVVWFSAKRILNEGAYLENNSLVWQWQGERRVVMRADELNVWGGHNIENALTAIALAGVWGARVEAMRDALREFRGVEHRLELVGEMKGVRFINDTTATAPAATIAALAAIAPHARKMILISGGADKDLDFGEMARAIAARNMHVSLLEGTATEKIRAALELSGAGERIIGLFNDMGAAVRKSFEIARPGDVVILSPGCASFGMFANEFERGNEFKRIVREITTI